VTGATSGNRRAIAVDLAIAGFEPVLARCTGALAELADKPLQRSGARVQVLPVDLSTNEGVVLVIETMAGVGVSLGEAATGYGTSGPLLASRLEYEVDLFRVNCEAELCPSHASPPAAAEGWSS
jgi:short-subunit dehydrogenase